MEKSKPVTNFVGDCSTEVVVPQRSTWGCGVEDVETISATSVTPLAIDFPLKRLGNFLERGEDSHVISRSDGSNLRKLCVSKISGNGVLKVDIQGAVCSLAEGSLHSDIVSVGIGSPGGVDGVVS